MKATNTAGTLISLRNWSTESICHPPKTTRLRQSCALLNPLHDLLIGRENLVGNGCPAQGEQRQNRDNGQGLHGADGGGPIVAKRDRSRRNFAANPGNIVTIPSLSSSFVAPQNDAAA
ncbi:hypothetical protein Q2941_35715 [Bradyrhizobium sp. UFLA05-153]